MLRPYVQIPQVLLIPMLKRNVLQRTPYEYIILAKGYVLRDCKLAYTRRHQVDLYDLALQSGLAKQ